MPTIPTTLDLFSEIGDTDIAGEYRQAAADWLAQLARSGQLQREASVGVYTHMWEAFAEWACARGVAIDRLGADDLDLYIDTRGGHADLSARYAWRLLRLVDRILGHRGRSRNLVANAAAATALARRPEFRYANAHDKDPLPEFLAATEAKRLVTFLSAVRPGKGGGVQPWQDVRNRTSVALMLGAGVTPGEVRTLVLDDVVAHGGRGQGVPWKLRVGGNGNAPPRETPIAAWAGQLLRHWLQTRAEQGIPGTMLLPSTRSSGKPWGKVAQYNATRQVLEAASIDDVEGGSFRLRHTFALRQLRKGKSPAEVAKWLGVTDPAVMARYARVIAAPIDVV